VKDIASKSIDQGSSSGARNVRWNDPRKDSLYLDDADVVGIESPRDELIGWLVEGSASSYCAFGGGNGGIGQDHSCQESLRPPKGERTL
jgi:disease resistance protein RPM1